MNDFLFFFDYSAKGRHRKSRGHLFGRFYSTFWYKKLKKYFLLLIQRIFAILGTRPKHNKAVKCSKP